MEHLLEAIRNANRWVDIFGVNPDIDAAEDLINVGGDVNFPSAAATTTVVSSSTNDDGDPAGTGAQTVRIRGLDANYAEVTDTVTMDGTTPVTFGTDLLRVNDIKVLTAGSVGSNDGRIDVKHGATVLASAEAGFGTMSDAIYTLPANTAGYIVEIKLFAEGNASGIADVGIFRREENGAWQLLQLMAVSAGEGIVFDNELPEKITAKSDIKVRALAVSATNMEVSIDLNMVEVDA